MENPEVKAIFMPFRACGAKRVPQDLKAEIKKKQSQALALHRISQILRR